MLKSFIANLICHKYTVHLKINNKVYIVFPQHWIRLEMLPDILLHRLYMKVEPSDSSYMPSLVVISAGDTLSSMKEIRAVNITSSESVVTLLQDLNDVSGSFQRHFEGEGGEIQNTLYISFNRTVSVKPEWPDVTLVTFILTMSLNFAII